MLARTLLSAVTAAALSLAASIPRDGALGLTKREPGCVGPWAPLHTVGGDTGTPFCESSWKHDYAPISEIEVFRNPNGWHIAGIRFTYVTGQQSQTYGTADTSNYPSYHLRLKPSELITSCILYGNGKGQYLGHIHIETSMDQTWDVGCDTKGFDPYEVETGGGLLFGATGQHGSSDKDGKNDDLVNLTFLFLGQGVDRVEVSDINYDTSKIENQGKVNPTTVNVGTYFNKASTNVTVAQDQEFDLTTSHSFSQSSTSTFSFTKTLEVSAELFGIGAKSNNEFSWTKSNEKTSSLEDTQGVKLTCKLSPTTIAPNKGIKAIGTFANGTADIPYDSQVTVHLKDKTSFSYRETGKLESTSYTDCHVVIEDNNDSSVPNTASVLDSSSEPQRRGFSETIDAAPLVDSVAVAPIS